MSGSDLKELRKKVQFLEAENKQLLEEIVQNKAQLTQFKSVNESQQAALKDKDSLLEQLQQVNDSLQSDLKVLRDIKPSSTVPAFPGAILNPWTDSSMTPGTEPEQYRKLFIGGLNYETTETSLRDHFEGFGEVQKAAVIMDGNNQSRGFGFIIYKTAAMIDAAQAGRPHVVDGRNVDTKRALPKEDTNKPENSARVKKLFVGGFNRETEEEHLREYFSKFGNVENVDMLVYKDTGRKRGFAFVSFDDFDPVDKSVLIKHHVINSCRCEVKKAVGRNEISRRNFSGGSGGSWGSHGGSNDRSGSYGGKGGDFGGNQGGNFGGNQGGNFGGNQGGSFGSGQSSNFGGGQGNFGGNQGGNFGGGQGGNFGGNQGGNFGGNQGGNQGGYDGNYGGNQGRNYGGNQGGNYGGSQSGNYGGNQGNFDGNRGGNQGDSSGSNSANATSSSVPPEMAAMWSAFYTQYMSTSGGTGGGGTGSGSSGAGPIRNNDHSNRANGPYPPNSASGNHNLGQSAASYGQSSHDYSGGTQGSIQT